MELAPQSVDILLLVIHSGVLHQVISYCRVCSVCTNQEVKPDFDFFIAFSRSGFPAREPGFVVFEIGPSKFVVEEEFDVGHCLEFVQEKFVEPSSIGGIVCLKIRQA